MKRLTLGLFASLSFSALAVEVPQSFTFQGKIYDSRGVVVEVPTTFTVQVFSPDGTCLLYEETHTRPMTRSAGVFALNIGEGVNTNSSPLPFSKLFGNTAAVEGAASCDFQPVAGDTRRLRITYDTGSEVITVPVDQHIRSVPYALNTETLQGLSKSNFVQTSAASTQAKFDDIMSQHSALMGLVTNMSGVAMSFSSGSLTVPTTPATGNSVVNKTYSDSNLGGRAMDLSGVAEGSSLVWDATNSKWKTLAVTSGTVKSVTAGTGLVGGVITNTGTIGLASSGIVPGVYPKVTVDTYGRATSGGFLLESDIPALSTGGKVSGNAITSGTISGTTAFSTSGNVTTTGLMRSPRLDLLSTSGKTVSLTVPAGVASDTTLTFPGTTGLVGQVLMSDGSGNLSWGSANSALNSGVNTSGDVVTTGQLQASKVNVVSLTGKKLSITAPSTLASDLSLIFPETAGTSGQILSTDGAGNLSWTSVSAAPFSGTTSTAGLLQLAASGEASASKAVSGTDSRLSDSRAPNGSATGDLSGSYPNPTVAKLQGRLVSSAAPGNGASLLYDGSTWTPGYSPITNVKNSLGVAQVPLTCTSSQTLVYSYPLNAFQCADIEVNASAIDALKASSGDASSSQIVMGNDSRLTNSRAPSGSATGDLTGSYPAPTLAASGVSAGTYTKVTVDLKGRVTVGDTLTSSDFPALDWAKITSGKPTTLSGFGVTDGVKNNGGVSGMASGLDASKGAAGTAGRVFIATDSAKVYYDNGSSWSVVSAVGSGTSGTVTSVTAGTGLVSQTITGSGTLNVDVGVTANKIVQLDGSAKLPAVDGSQLTNLNTPYTQMRVVDASGSWTVPAGVTKVFVEVWGGGAGGAGAKPHATVTNGGGPGGLGGGAGAYGSWVHAVTPGSNISITIGAGGNGGAANNNGSNGSASSFDGVSVNGGLATGVGGTATLSATLNGISGGNGGFGSIYSMDRAILVGGFLKQAGVGGLGGSSPKGGIGGNGSNSSSLAGNAGAAPGGGGGGGGNSLNDAPSAGGAGAKGRVVIWY